MSFLAFEEEPPHTPIEEIRERIEHLKYEIPQLPREQAHVSWAMIQAYEHSIEIIERGKRLL